MTYNVFGGTLNPTLLDLDTKNDHKHFGLKLVVKVFLTLIAKSVLYCVKHFLSADQQWMRVCMLTERTDYLAYVNARNTCVVKIMLV